jgi:hypothetical protein
LSSTVIDRLVIVAYGDGPPTEHEWRDYLRLIERQGVGQAVHLVATEGGEPTIAQRRQLAALQAGRRVPVAVVSDSALVRGTVMLLSCIDRQIKAFPRAHVADALEHLEIPTSRTGLVEDALRRLQADVRAG